MPICEQFLSVDIEYDRAIFKMLAEDRKIYRLTVDRDELLGLLNTLNGLLASQSVAMKAEGYGFVSSGYVEDNSRVPDTLGGVKINVSLPGDTVQVMIGSLLEDKRVDSSPAYVMDTP